MCRDRRSLGVMSRQRGDPVDKLIEKTAVCTHLLFVHLCLLVSAMSILSF